MLFNSIEYLIFLPTVFILYWFVFNKNLKVQNLFLLVVSYTFYGWWDWRFLSLILFSSLVDYWVGISIENSESVQKRKNLKYLSLIVNLGFLGIFKYYNFFIDSFVHILETFGLNPSVTTLKILLPVGISFYTFQTIGYTLDIYKKRYKAEKNLVNFMVYVSFFPQLVAGPIERGKNLLPQIREKRAFSDTNSRDGLRLILVGLFKKVVIADNLANSVDYIFANYQGMSTTSLILGGAFFIIQIYCDFAGYSDIAIGTAKLFGFKLMKNFDFPFYVASIQEFWTRWHISLSNWFRDYLLFGLKSSFKNRIRFALNFLFTLTIIGFWHGANWTFIIFGFINGLYILPGIVWSKVKVKVGISRKSVFPRVLELTHMVKVFILLIIPGIFFRSPDVKFAFSYFRNIFNSSDADYLPDQSHVILSNLIWFILPLLLEWPLRSKEHSLDINHIRKPIRWLIYIILIVTILNYGEFHYKQFIYFQF